MRVTLPQPKTPTFLRYFGFALLATLVLSVASTSLSQTPSLLEDGVRLYRSGDYKAAIKTLNAATKQNKSDVETWHFLGLALRRVGDQKKARKAFETALKLQPTYLSSRVALADTLISLGKMEEADEEANRAVLQAPTSAEAHFLLGKIDLMQRRCGHAPEHVENAIKLNPQFGAPYLLKAQLILCGLTEETYRSRIETAVSPRESGQTPVGQSAERREGIAKRYAEAAANVQKFIELSPRSDELSIWKEQLETLKVYAQFGSPRTIYFGNEVTTKVRVLSKPEPAYTPDAKAAGVIGTVILRAVLAGDGTVKHILVLSGLPYGLTDRCLEAAKQIRFEPATLNGNKVSSFVQLEYNFNLF